MAGYQPPKKGVLPRRYDPMRLFQQLGMMVGGMLVVSASLLMFFYLHADEAQPVTGDFAAEAPPGSQPADPGAPEPQPAPEAPLLNVSVSPDLPVP